MATNSFSYEDLYASLLRTTTELIETARAEGLSDNLEFFNFDTVGDVSELPKVDLMGLGGVSFEREPQGFIEVKCFLALSTLDDANAFRRRGLINLIDSRLQPGGKVRLIHAGTGEEITRLLVTASALMPPARTEVRAMQAYALEMIPVGH